MNEIIPQVPQNGAPENESLNEDWAQIIGAFEQGPEGILALNVARQRQNEVATGNQLLEDERNMSVFDFHSRYGDELHRQMGRLQVGNPEYERLMSGERTGWRRTGDNVNNVATGLLGGIGDAGALVAGAVSNRAGHAIAQGTDMFREGMQSLQSDQQANNRFLSGIRSELDSIDNANQFDRDREGGDSNLVASLSYFGRGLVNGASQLFEDGLTFETALGEGVGSLFAGGPISKGVSLGIGGLRAVGRASVREGAENAGIAVAGQAGRWGDRATMPIAIGLMEGGSAYSGTIMEVMGMSHEELMETSPRYQDLISRGMDPETAQRQVASHAAQVAGAITAPIAGVTGRMVAGFEAAPLASRSFPQMVRNILAETVEEGIQGATGTIGQNIGMQVADENRGPLEGAGEATGQGAILGGAIGGVVQAPGIARSTAVGAGRAAVRAVAGRGEQIEAENQEAAGTSERAIMADIQTATQSVDEVVEAVQSVAGTTQPNDDPEIDAVDPQSILDRIISQTEVSPDEFSDIGDNLTAERDRREMGPPQSAAEAVVQMGMIARDTDVDQETRTAAGLYLLQRMQNQENLLNEDMDVFLENTPHDSPEYQAIDQYRNMMGRVAEIPAVKEAMDWARENQTSPTTEADTLRAAEVRPGTVDPTIARRMLYQDGESKTPMTPEQRRALRASLSLVQTGEALIQSIEQTKSEGEITSPAQAVSQQIEVTGGRLPNQMSLEQHTVAVTSAMNQKKTKAATNRMKALRAFAQHMQNKVAAWNESIQTGQPVEFDRFGPNGALLDQKGKATAHKDNANSMAMGRRIHAEAVAVNQLLESLAQTYPELGVSPVGIPDLDAGFSPKAKEVSRVTPEQATRLSDKGLSERMNSIMERIQAKTPQKGDQATFNVLEAEQAARKKKAQTPPKKPAELKKTGKPETRMSALKKIVENDNKKGKIPLEVFTKEELDVLKNDFKALVGRKYVTVPENLSVYAAEQMGSVAGMENLTPPPATPPADPKMDAQVIADELAEQEGKKARRAAALERQARLDEAEAFSNMKPKERLVARFPSLVQVKTKLGEMTNWFHRAFSMPNDATSRFQENSGLMETLADILNENTDIEKFLGKKLPYELTQEQKKQYMILLRNARQLSGRLNMRLQHSLMEKGMLKRLEDGKEITRYKNGKVLNLIEPTKGKNYPSGYRYNQDLLDAATMAAIHWRMNVYANMHQMTQREVAEMLGRPEEDVEIYMDFFNSGMNTDRAVSSLAQVITDFWGVARDKTTTDAYVKGIPQGLAQELIMGMSDAALTVKGEVLSSGLGMLNIVTEKLDGIQGETGPKTYNQIQFTENTNAMDVVAPVKGFLADAVLLKPHNKGWHIGQAPTEVSRTQIRNPIIKNTNEQIQAIKKLQSIPHRVNVSVADFVRNMGAKNFIMMMGGKDYTPEKTNKKHELSLKGKNLSLQMAYVNVLAQVDEMKAHAEAAGKPLSAMESFFEWGVNKVGRFQMSGMNNPEADKLAREVHMPTRSVLNMADPFGQDAQGFWKAIAQGIGLKTHQRFGHDTMDTAMEMTLDPSGSLAQVVDAMVAWKDNPETSTEAMVPMLQEALGKDLTMHAVQSLLAVADYKRALRDGNREALNQFETFAYLEADGVTNGPIMALIKYATGEFSEAWVNLVAKGGLLFGDTAQSLNNYYNSGEPGADTDLYKKSANRNQELSQMLRRGLNSDAEAQMDRLFRLMEALKIDVKLNPNEGTISIGRNSTKNPLTISIYGSGKNGIIGNVAQEIMDAFYAHLTDSMEAGTEAGDLLTMDDGTPYGAQRLGEDLQNLITFTAHYNKETQKVSLRNAITGEAPLVENFDDVIEDFNLPIIEGKNEPFISDMRNFVLSAENMETFMTNVGVFFVNDMHQAITDTVMGHVKPSTQAMQVATQMQSLVMEAMFNNEIISKLADKAQNPEQYPDYIPGDGLSEAELQVIWNDLLMYGPIIESDTQQFFVGGNEVKNRFETQKVKDKDGNTTNVSMPETNSSTLVEDKLRFAPGVHGPAEAGVSVIPSLTIGTGDALAMQKFFAKRMKELTGVLSVYDGLNIAANQINQVSEQMNHAVLDTWVNNPVRAVEGNFSIFMNNDIGGVIENMPNNSVKEKLMLGMAKVLYETDKPPVDRVPVHEITQKMYETQQLLQHFAEEIDIRQEVLKRVSLSVDQMAGAESPFHQAGSVVIPAGSSPAEIVAILNDVRSEIIAERAEANRNAVAEPSRQRAMLEGKAPKDPSGAYVVPSSKLKSIFMKQLWGNLPKAHMVALNSTIEFLQKSDYEVVIGSRDEVNAYQKAHFPESYDANEGDYHGKVDPVNKRAYIVNLNSETLAHELIHVATVDKITAFYNNDNAERLSAQDKNALTRIEGLMKEFISEPLNFRDRTEQFAHGELVGRLSSILNDPMATKAEAQIVALSEFLAYALTQQKLVDAMRRTKVKNPLLRIMDSVLSTLKELIWGKDAESKDVGSDFYSQLLFNARVVIKSNDVIFDTLNDFKNITLYQSPEFGADPRISRIRASLDKSFQDFSKYRNKIDSRREAAARREALIKAVEVSDSFITNGFSMTPQQHSTFNMIVAGLSTEIGLNANSRSRIQDMYQHVISKLDVKDFQENPNENDQNDYAQALKKYNVLNGVYLTKTDDFGRSSLMSSFLALAVVHPEFREILSKMEKPKQWKDDSGTLDAALNNFGVSTMERLSRMVSGDKKNSASVGASIDALTENLVHNINDQRTVIEMESNNLSRKMEKLVSENIQKLGDKGVAAGQALASRNRSKLGKTVGKALSNISAIVTKEGVPTMAKGLVHALNQNDSYKSLKEVIYEAIGRTSENAPIMDMVAKTRWLVDQIRQQFREELPLTLKKAFTEKLTKEQWNSQTVVLQKTDLSAVMNAEGRDKALSYISDGRTREGRIRELENQIEKVDPNHKTILLKKAEQYANFMINGYAGENLLRNAEAIAHLFQETTRKGRTVPKELAPILDQLISLYALKMTKKSDRDLMKDLIENQKSGVDFVLDTLAGIRNDEVNKSTSSAARFNHYKGNVRGLNQEGVHLVVAEQREWAKLLGMGYKRVGDYNGSTADVSRQKRAYFFAPVSGMAKFNQGTIQTVRQTQSGVDPLTGYSTDVMTAGRITSPDAVRAVQRRLKNQKATDENLMPVYDSQGKVVAYERAVDPAQLKLLEHNTNLAEIMGAWRGRQMEEIMGNMVNDQIIENLKGIWDTAKKEGQTNQFVDMSKITKADDPVLFEAWGLIPHETKAKIESTFGEGAGFHVRRDMLNMAVGARSATVGDFWTGNSRWSPEVQKKIQKVAMGIFKNQAYTNLVNTEKFWQEAVLDAKLMIVIKSGIIPAANLMANAYQLLTQNVPLRSLLGGLRDKTSELNDYMKRRRREVQLDADLLAARGRNDTRAMRKIENQIQSIQDSYRSLTIWPLLEAGEFSSISLGGVTKEEIALSEGRWGSVIENLQEKMPAGLKTPYRYFMVTRDTPLFKSMAIATQYGDFLGKAILYDHLTKNEGWTKEDALAKISEEFVNYNLFAGRSRAWAESSGLLWFYNFKLRSIKVGARMLRDNPVKSLLFMTLGPTMPVIGGVGSPLTDNWITSFLEGRAGYSVGPGMMTSAVGLNPWVNMVR